MKVQTYLFFDGCCEEALGFYRDKLGAQIGDLMRYKEMPAEENAPPVAAENAEKIMYSSFHLGSTTLMASDGIMGTHKPFESFSLTLEVAEIAEAERLFAVLAEEGQVQMPLTPKFFSPCFGVVADKFGVSWMVMAESK